jgi:hypothetical protein
MRRRYRYDPTTKQMMEIAPDAPSDRERGVLVVGDMEPFVSPIDGQVISGRARYRSYCKEKNLTNSADYTNEWKKKADERAKFYTGDKSYDRTRRLEHLKQAYDKYRR